MWKEAWNGVLSSHVPTTSAQVDLVAISIAGLNVWLGRNERNDRGGWLEGQSSREWVYIWLEVRRLNCVWIWKHAKLALLGQLAERRSHNPEVVSLILTESTHFSSTCKTLQTHLNMIGVKWSVQAENGL